MMKRSKNNSQVEEFSDGFTLLMVYCENGNFEEVQKIVVNSSKKKLKVELTKTNNIGNTALSLAVKNHYYDIVQFLIDKANENGCKFDIINHVNNAKQPILFIPCWNNDIEMVNILFEAGSDVNYQDSRGWTPLMIAASQGYETLVEFLLHKEANVDLKDKYGK
jgi:ankyrin repeat protein